MITVCWLLAGLLAAVPNLLPGDSSGDLGPGPWQLAAAPGALLAPAWREGALWLPAPGSRLELPASLALPPGEPVTLAWRLRGSGAVALRLTLRDSAGQQWQTTLRPGPTWQPGHWTVAALPPPVSPAAAREAGLDWAQRRVVPGETTPTARLSLSGETVGRGEVWIDDLRLVHGTVAAPVAPRSPCLDLSWRANGPAGSVLPGTLTLRLAGRGLEGQTVALTVRAADGWVQQQQRLAPLAPQLWEVPLPDLPAGLWEVTAAAGETAVQRWLAVAPDRTLDEGPEPPWVLTDPALELAAEARAWGCRQARLVVPWRDAADAAGRPQFEALDARLAPLRAMRLRLNLVLALSPQERLPAQVLSSRRSSSHGLGGSLALPDLERFLAWTRALVDHLAAEPVVWELDEEPARYWAGADYVEYLRRFRETVLAADPAATLAGAGTDRSRPPADPAQYAALRRAVLEVDAAELLERRTLFLAAGRLGDDPDRQPWWEDLGLLEEGSPPGAERPALQLAPRALRPVAPLEAGPRLVTPERLADEVSPFQLAARQLLEFWQSQPLVGFPTGWTGGYGPREAVWEAWRARWGVVGRLRSPHRAEAGWRWCAAELPDGRAVALVWDPTDDRLRSTAPRLDGRAPRLRIRTMSGVLLRAFSLYGRERRECYRGAWLDLPLSFEPTLLEAPRRDLLEGWLEAATLHGVREVAARSHLSIRDGRPGLQVSLRHLARGAGEGAVRLAGSPGCQPAWTAAASGDEVDWPGQEWWVPVSSWQPGRPGRWRVTAETGRTVQDLSRGLLYLPRDGAPPPAVDALLEDWPERLAPIPLGGTAHLLRSEVDWLGPDDASAQWRLCPTAEGFVLGVEVRDNQLQMTAPDPATGGDAVELCLDFDPAGEPQLGPTDAVLRLFLAPGTEGQFTARCKTVVPPRAPALLTATRVRARQVPGGWQAEARLDLSPWALARLREQDVCGFDLLLHDDDGAGREVQLAACGDGEAGSRQRLGQLWCPATRLPATPPAGPAPETLPPPPVSLGFESSAEPYRLLPGEWGEAVVGRCATPDFVRGEHGLAVDLTRCGAEPRPILSSRLPATARRWSVTVWARARSAALPLRLGLRAGDAVHWIEPPPAWWRWDVDLPAGDWQLLTAGAGRLELAELTARPALLGVEPPPPRSQVARRLAP
ncbi:MAG: hypothetical protein IT204_06625 [Fimbriimonadaceae bacterium]|nr:hypothetical protein [Fimbriimonadaceae bacterium]